MRYVNIAPDEDAHPPAGPFGAEAALVQRPVHRHGRDYYDVIKRTMPAYFEAREMMGDWRIWEEVQLALQLAWPLQYSPPVFERE